MKWVLIAGSAMGHVAAMFGLDQIPQSPAEPPPTPITIVESKVEEPEAVEPPEPEPSEEPPEPVQEAQPESAEPPPAASPDPAPSEASSLNALPDLGLELSGTSGTGTGFAVASRPQAAPKKVERRLINTQVSETRPVKVAPCAEGGSPKPKLLRFNKPAYSEAARAAGVTGKLRINITVGPDGQVEQAVMLQGLGHGLDDATLQAARAASFEAATQCGKSVRSNFTMSVRFSAE